MTVVVIVLVGVCGVAIGVAIGAARARTDAPGPDDSVMSISGWDLLARELERARRYERPMTLVRLPLAPTGADAPSATEHPSRLESVRGALRTLDFAWGTEDAVFALLPETRRPEGQTWVDRLAADLPDLEPGGVTLAEFPADGLTSGALFDRLTAEAGADGASVPSQVVLGLRANGDARFAS